MPQRKDQVLVGRFEDAVSAETAGRTVSAIMKAAESEADAVFARQGGVAMAADIAAVYSRHGFRNDIGWRQEQPIAVSGEDLVWPLPEGLMADEAELLLLSLGALDLELQTGSDEEPWRLAPHPRAWAADPDEEPLRTEREDEEPSRPASPEKKLLH